MNLKKITVLSGACLLLCFSAATLHGQPMAKQLIADFGASFTQTTVSGAPSGFVGLDMQYGRMLTNGLSIGVGVGYDVVALRKVEGIYERLAVIPMLAKAKYYLTIAPSMQVHASLAAGAFQTLPHLVESSIGGISETEVRAGGAAGVGFDYWFLGTKGIGGEVEYNAFKKPRKETFSYFAVRVNFIIVKL